jgi:hypothetical protein
MKKTLSVLLVLGLAACAPHGHRCGHPHGDGHGMKSCAKCECCKGGCKGGMCPMKAGKKHHGKHH